jgi:hypothetical protein
MRALANAVTIATLPFAAEPPGVPLRDGRAMSVSLHQRLLHESAGAAPALPRGLRLPWRDSATQQLDALEAANRRLSANRIGGNGLWLLLVAAALALVVLGSSWPSASPAPVAPMRPAPAVAPLPLPVSSVQPEPLPVALPQETAAPHAAPEPALAVIDEAARQQAARARALADARRQAARVAQERTLAEKDALRASEGRQAEPVAEAAPAPRAAEPPAAQRMAHAAPRESVRETCSGAGFFGQHLCQARECRKPEREGDDLCVRLREIDQARSRSDQ